MQKKWMMTVALMLCATVAYAGQTAAAAGKKPAQAKVVDKENDKSKKEGPESEADEQKVALKDLPAAVKATVEAETKNATIKKITKETEKGKTVYEVASLVNGRTRDFMIDATGKVYQVEEQLDADKAPAPVRSALEAQGTILVLESVNENGVTTYEGQVKTKAGKKLTMELDAAGKPIKK
jgi:uncharacterized membrane protein YkoI